MPDNDFFKDSYLSCRSYLARAISRIVPPHEIEDIVQETYVRMCQFRSSSEVKSPRALMVRIARNLALDHVKRAEWRVTDQFDEELAAETGKPWSLSDETYRQVTSDEEFAQFCDAVRQLPLQCRRVFVLKKVYGYSQREIAGELNISESTVEKHIAKGMKLCACYMLQRKTARNGALKEPRRTALGKGGGV